MNIILLGAPGAGKGTQAALLTEHLRIPAVSTGNMLRAAIKAGTSTGLEAKAYMDRGELVPDQVIIGIITDRLRESDCQEGFILDGVPRTIGQAEALDAANIHFDFVVDLDVSDETIMERMSGRRVCVDCGATFHVAALPPRAEGICDACGGKLAQRDDDKPETVKSRLDVYHRETEPLENYYQTKGILKKIPDCGNVDATFSEILGALGQSK